MAKQGFKRNAKAVANILRTVDGGKRAAAEKVLEGLPADARKEAFIEVYETDREVVGIVVRADVQAKHGAGTRAAARAGLKRGGKRS